MSVAGSCTCGEPMVLGVRRVVVNWIAPTDEPVIRYELEAHQNGVTSTIYVSASDTYMFYEFTGLLPNTPFKVRIRATLDGENWGPFVDTSSVIPLDPPSVGPSSATAALLENNRDVEVSWTPPNFPPEGPYMYSVQSVSENPFTIQYGYQTADTSIVSYTFTNMNPGITYSFQVKIVNNAGESEPTSTQPIDIPFIN